MTGSLRLLAVGSALAIAAASSPGTSVAGVAVADTPSYFDFERVQLTAGSLAALGSDAELFRFYNEADTSTKLTSEGACKVFPGDASWPSDATWETFNGALGNNALIKTVPLAAPCYNAWDYDQAKCASLTANWTSSYLQ